MLHDIALFKHNTCIACIIVVGSCIEVNYIMNSAN
jgi:hypothetical protein